jgi:sugar phosphate permease
MNWYPVAVIVVGFACGTLAGVASGLTLDRLGWSGWFAVATVFAVSAAFTAMVVVALVEP